MQVASGFATHPSASPDLAGEAVASAMHKAGLSHAGSVLLFLTPEFARDPQPALRAAARAANCTQIMGCSAVGILTEEDWVLDAPAAAALVFGAEVSLQPWQEKQESADLLLTLAAPNAIHTEWLESAGLRFGGVAGDATGQGPFGVWQGGRPVPAGRCEAGMHGVHGVVGVSQGVRPLSRQPFEITRAEGFDVQMLAGQPAFNVLTRELPLELRGADAFPLHRLMAGMTYGDPATAIAAGRFRSTPIIAVNPGEGGVTLAVRPQPGERLFWAMRQPLAAERDMRLTVERLHAELAGDPDFGLCFSCMGRGPYFHGGMDRDLQVLQQRFPGMPLIGFYGNGEFAPFQGSNQLFQYAAVVGLFRHV